MEHNGNGKGSSLSDLEREAELTRAELAQTFDALHSRVTPDAIKRDAKDYARQTGQHLLQTIESRARENPLAAVAVAAGLAIPLLRMVSNMPAPVLLIGAGLAMSRRNSSASNTSAAYGQRFPEGSGQSAGDKISSVANSISEKASGVIEGMQHKAEAVGSRVTGAVADTANSARDMASGAATAIAETTMDMKRQAADRVNRTQESIVDTIERYPLLVGGLAFAVGGLIASALPVTRSENRLMGSASDTVKNRAKDIADEGMKAASASASKIYENAAEQTRQQGLTPATARDTVRNVMDQAGAAIDKAAAAAESSTSKPAGGRSSRKPRTSNSESDNG